MIMKSFCSDLFESLCVILVPDALAWLVSGCKAPFIFHHDWELHVGCFGSIKVAELDWGNEDHISAVDPPFDYIIGKLRLYKRQIKIQVFCYRG